MSVWPFFSNGKILDKKTDYTLFMFGLARVCIKIKDELPERNTREEQDAKILKYKPVSLNIFQWVTTKLKELLKRLDEFEIIYLLGRFISN